VGPLRGARLDRVLNVEEMRALARRRLPGIVFDAIEGGAGDELSVEANRAAFRRLWFRPAALADVSRRDLATTVLGQEVSMPLLLAPCGMARLVHAESELGAVRAAGAVGTLYAVSAAASQSLEAIAAAGDRPALVSAVPSARAFRCRGAARACCGRGVRRPMREHRQPDLAKARARLPQRPHDPAPHDSATVCRGHVTTAVECRFIAGRTAAVVTARSTHCGRLSAPGDDDRRLPSGHIEDLDWLRDHWSGASSSRVCSGATSARGSSTPGLTASSCPTMAAETWTERGQPSMRFQRW